MFVKRFLRKNVPLKKVNSKYILKSTLTPRLARKQFHKNTTGLERSRSWSSLDNGTIGEHDYACTNYLTVHVSLNVIFKSFELNLLLNLIYFNCSLEFQILLIFYSKVFRFLIQSF